MSGRILRKIVRDERLPVLAGLAAAIFLAWGYLLLGAGIAGMKGGKAMMPMRPEWSPGYAALVFIMWAVMMAAMLLVARVAGRRAGGGPAARADPKPAAALFVLGYLAVWSGFAAAATALQWLLDTAGLLSPAMALGNAVMAGGVLVAAGLYQWTPLKAACLRHCRSPLDFLLFHWRDGAFGMLASGARHGLFCLGCCWMLMALLFVGGVMSLAWVGTLALLVLIEKTLPWGGRMSRITG